MKSNVSLSQIVSVLEAKLAVCQEKVAYHAEQERKHREERERYDGELTALKGTLEAFQSAAAQAVELAGERLARAALPPEEAGGGKLPIAKMVARVLELRDRGEPFGVTAVTEAVNQRYRNRLREPVESRQVSVVLRWMLRTKRLRSVRKGRPFHEALYTKV